MDVIKQLRSITNGGIAECKRALEEAHGDLERAVACFERRRAARDAEIAANFARLDQLASPESLESVVARHVAMGFYAAKDICRMVSDHLELRDPRVIRQAVDVAIAAKEEQARRWAPTTDCDRLDLAFESLAAADVVALQNAGFDPSDGFDCAKERAEALGARPIGFCYFHFQDVANCIAERGLWLAFGAFRDQPDQPIGELVMKHLSAAGLAPVWSKQPSDRISLPSLVWQRRGPELGASLRVPSGAIAEYFCR